MRRTRTSATWSRSTRATIKIDAARFQFKSGGDAQGVTNALTGVKEWDNNASGIALVWEDEKGDRYIVDGHQRLGLAQRLKAQGQTPRLPAIVLREKDGIAADKAMLRVSVRADRYRLQCQGSRSSTLVIL